MNYHVITIVGGLLLMAGCNEDGSCYAAYLATDA